ncbi:MAG: hypothetical protein LBT02_01105 [Rickettsiales bacterium]|jgi:hypothetical protein|nr:hypothetical protein [Rickettsiales bacterium]
MVTEGVKLIASGGMDYNGLYYTGVLSEIDNKYILSISTSRTSKNTEFNFDKKLGLEEKKIIIENTDDKLSIKSTANNVSLTYDKENNEATLRRYGIPLRTITTEEANFTKKTDGSVEFNINIANLAKTSVGKPLIDKIVKDFQKDLNEKVISKGEEGKRR